jgi:hypothetical protein
MNLQRPARASWTLRKDGVQILGTLTLMILTVAALALTGPLRQAAASSHREAPMISADPQADNTDLYAFVSPDAPNTVTIVANYIPLEQPQGGPNFYKFGDDVLYEIKIDNDGDGEEDVNYQFRFHTDVRNPETFLYNTGPITSLDDTTWNIRQFYSVTRIEGRNHEVLGSNLKTPPVNIGPRSTPNYDTLASAAISTLASPYGNRKFFAGQRDDPFFVDLGSIFDLGGLRPFNNLHILPLPVAAGVDGVSGYNTHSIVMQVPIRDLTRGHVMPTGPADPRAVVGIYASSRRASTRILYDDGTVQYRGREVQVSRLGYPLINEVIIPVGEKDYWNARDPAGDSEFAHYYLNPELTRLENALYPALDNANETNRQDLVQILLTGIPTLNYTGPKKMDLLRLNMAVPPSAVPDRLGAIAGQLDGFPNGRRLGDDTVDIELRATAEGYGPILAGLLGLPNRSPNNLLGDGVDANDKPFLATFPYLASPWQGYEAQPPTATPAFAHEKMSRIEQLLNGD